MSDESLDLPQVQAAFREAQLRFEELARAAQDLDSASSQLTDARIAVNEAATRLAELAESSMTVSERLAEATRAIEATDPAELQARLQALADSLAAMSESQQAAHREITSTVSESQLATEASRRSQHRLQLILGIVTLLAVIAFGILALTR